MKRGQSFFEIPEREHGCKMPTHHSIALADQNMRTALEIANEEHVRDVRKAWRNELAKAGSR